MRKIPRPPGPLFLSILCLIGLWQMGEGMWIYAKAGLAQLLLKRAWALTRSGEAGMKPWPWADTWPLARLVVPSQGIDMIVLNGAYGRTLAFGPGYVESSALPGLPGTTIISGHRDTHFSFLRRLQRDDAIVLETPDGRRPRYRVHDTRIVDARTASIVFSQDADRLILVTCYPFDSIMPGGSLRYVVTATRLFSD